MALLILGFLKRLSCILQTSDPLTQFACAFSALIHDVDHSGVSNAQLVKEKTEDAIKYNNRSVAEQNSLDLSWNLMMDERFIDFREFLLPTQTEVIRFRQLVVNVSLSKANTKQCVKDITSFLERRSQQSLSCFHSLFCSHVTKRFFFCTRICIVCHVY